MIAMQEWTRHSLHPSPVNMFIALPDCRASDTKGPTKPLTELAALTKLRSRTVIPRNFKRFL